MPVSFSPSRVAAIQMNSRDQVQDNLDLAAELVASAVADGARFVLLPEYFYFMGKEDQERLAFGEDIGNGPIQRFLSDLARHHQIWISGGTVPIQSEDPLHLYNSNLLFNDEGHCVGRYDKIHLFGFKDSTESYAESDTLKPGNTVTTFTTPIGQIRASVCYDLRFPELYRLAPNCDLITAPAAFTYTTGAAHWEILLRCRAIENQCYVIAAAQTGMHPSGKRTFGHSMIIDPWGNVMAEKADGNGFVIADLDLQRMNTIRQNLPSLQNRVL